MAVVSALRDRLGKLRPTEPAPAQTAPVQPDLSGRMQRLRGAGRERREQDDAVLAERLGGVCIADGVIGVRETLPLDHGHGRVGLGEAFATSLDVLAPGRSVGIEDLVFMDTETTGLAGGTGTVVFLLGLARLGPAGLELMQWVLTRFSGEAALLEAARQWMAGSQAVVTFNGRSFDIPLLAARYRLKGGRDPFSALPQIDLLHPTRRVFARRWPDCRLQSAEQRLLEFRRHHDLPGAMAPQAWFDWVRRGSMALLPGVAKHNRWDLLSLAALLPVLEAVYRDPGPWGGDPLAVARVQRERGATTTALAVLQGQAHNLCPAGANELARLHRNRGDWAAAVSIWQRLAADDDVEALERLSKFYEHVCGDFAQALRYAERLTLTEPANPAHGHRLQRLHSRLGRRVSAVADAS
ncbi:MAG: ribonuclease H-like domain-containing protein [Gammaproteobacteria bacterium]